jgi:hypothetical protein
MDNYNINLETSGVKNSLVELTKCIAEEERQDR